MKKHQTNIKILTFVRGFVSLSSSLVLNIIRGKKLKLISGNSNRNLATAIAKKLQIELVKTNLSSFADGELQIELDDYLLHEDCVIVQSIAPSPKYSVNDSLMELCFIMDALNRIPVSSITLILPYLGYARQDRRVFPQSPISAKVVIDQICNMGADYAVTMDIHSEQLLGFFSCPVKNLYALPLLLENVKKKFKNMENTILVSPDMGSVKRTRFAADMLGCKYSIIDKNRFKPGESKVMHIIGECEGKNCILIDDMIDSAGTLCNAAEALMENGAKKVVAYASHGVLSGKANERINNSCLEEVTITDTILKDKDNLSKKIKILSSVDMFADAIKEIMS